MKTKSNPNRFFVCQKDTKGNIIPPVVQVSRSHFKKIEKAVLPDDAPRQDKALAKSRHYFQAHDGCFTLEQLQGEGEFRNYVQFNQVGLREELIAELSKKPAKEVTNA